MHQILHILVIHSATEPVLIRMTNVKIQKSRLCLHVR